MYRIAIHEASNRRRWFFRHKVQELSIEPVTDEREGRSANLRDSLVDGGESPFETVARGQVRARVEQVLQELPEHYRTAVVLRDIEDLSYEEIAEMTETSLGTVKSRLVRGREALRKRLERYAHELGPEAGTSSGADGKSRARKLAQGNREIEVTP
jgi:RNA polymerase sigma-70 factor (ECF subfamily)